MIIFLLFLFFWFYYTKSTTYADYEEFKSNLYEIWVWSDIIEQNKPLYRYDMVRLISTIKCIDCIHPPKTIQDEINKYFWDNFITLPWKNFDDIIWRTSTFNKENYYYCVGINAKDDVVNGYPRLTNVICPGKFCWNNLLTQGELIQIIYNIAKFQSKSTYEVNRYKIKTWIDTVDKNTNIYKSFNQTDLQNISNGVKRCNKDDCQISSTPELDAFMKYCTYRPNECGFVYFTNTTVGQRPLWELNMLMNEGILSIAEADKIEPNKISTTQQILSLIYRLNLKLQCEFDLDYDKDGIPNRSDNCPYIYNPMQSDIDKDSIWDVCDDDIDGDGSLNPLWISYDGGITDQNRINNLQTLDQVVKTYIIDKNISTGDIELNMWYDQCPFDSTTQNIIFDRENYGIWCKNLSSWTALSIDTYIDIADNRNIGIFEAISSGIDCKGKYEWDLWDGNKDIWKRIIHRYMEKWGYIVTVKDCVGNVAITQVYFGSSDLDKYALQILPDKLRWPNNFVSNIDNQRYWSYDNMKWIYENTLTTLPPTGVFSHYYTIPWSIPVLTYGFKDDKIRAISKANLYVIDSGAIASSYILADKITPNIGDKISLSTYISWFTTWDIDHIERDLDDNNKQKNNSISIAHTYFKPGTKIIQQLIYLKNNKKLENIIQLYVSEKVDDIFYANLIATPEIWYIWDHFSFKVNTPYEKDINTYQWSVSDGTYTQTTWPILNKIFYRVWTETITVKLTLKNKQIYDLGANIEIKSIDLCADPKKHICDMDKDSVPDICDDDIDGDGYKNILWLILSQDESCTTVLNPYKIDDNGNLSLHNPAIDNCPIVANKDQTNKDRDQFWDACDPYPNTPDPKNNGIKPYIPPYKKPDIINTNPWQPIWDLGDKFDEPSVIINNCISCPCQFYTNLGPVMEWDVVQATIKYDWGYIYSNPFLVK